MNYQWAIIGAGPAGIAAVGKLLDHGVSPHEIVWIDPHFSVGDFGTLWRNVPSNTKVESFLNFLSAANSFSYQQCNENFALHAVDPDQTCQLKLMADPLQWVTNHLKKTVTTLQDVAEEMTKQNRAWQIKLKNSTCTAKNVVLAIGADAKNLAFSSPQIIPLSDAMDSERIQQHCSKDDVIAVFGSSHSAILALRNLVESGVRKVVNFSRAPLRYAVYLDDYILFDDSGLKGTAAEWARNYIDGKLPNNLQRVFSNEENIEKYLPQCNKVVYAVGFERRSLPVVEGVPHLNYIEECGIIAPGLFGVGIAFPEVYFNPLGVREYRVGLRKFMEYLEKVVPIWLKYPG